MRQEGEAIAVTYRLFIRAKFGQSIVSEKNIQVAYFTAEMNHIRLHPCPARILSSGALRS